MADLSKLKVGGTVYNLKDKKGREDLAALIASLGGAAYKDVLANIDAGAGNIIDAATIKSYVDAQVGAIHKFDIVVVSVLPTASAETMYKIYLVPTPGASDGSKDEYLTVRNGTEGSYTYAWEMIGSTKPELTDYVKKTQKVAGIDLQDDITVIELQNALDLHALAHKDAGNVKISTADTLTMNAYQPGGDVALNAFTQTATAATISAKEDYTPAGTVTGTVTANGDIEVTLKNAAEATAAAIVAEAYTPAGSITGEAIKGGSISVTLGDATAATEATLTKADYTPAGTVTGTVSVPNAAALAKGDSGVQITGQVSKPDVNFVPVTAAVLNTISVAGQVATWTGATHTAAALGTATKGSFNTDAIKAHVAAGAEITGDVDAETLIFEAAATSNAVTEQGTFTPDTVNFGTFDGGSMPQFGTTNVVTSATAALATAPVFTGDKFTIGLTNGNAAIDATFAGTTAVNALVTKAEYKKQVVTGETFTPEAATLGFAGTSVANMKVTGVNYYKQVIDEASFTGQSADISATFAGAKAEQLIPKTITYDKATANGATFTGTTATLTGTLNKTEKTVDVEFTTANR